MMIRPKRTCHFLDTVVLFRNPRDAPSTSYHEFPCRQEYRARPGCRHRLRPRSHRHRHQRSGRENRQSAGELHRRGAEADAERFRRLVAEEGVVLFVVGLPLHLDGRESGKSAEARRFGQWLGEVTGVPIEFYDERFTSHEAEQLLLAADMTRKRRKKRLDMLAAQIILIAYLEGMRG